MATYTEIYLRRDSTLNWYATNPRLALGEPGIDLTLHRFKIGNGIDRWNELPYMDDDLYKLLDKQQQETADKVKDLLNKIAANKLDADTKHNALTTEVRNTSRELNTRMTAVEKEQAEYEESLTDEFTATKAEVHAGLEEFNDTRDKLTTRMDVIAGQSTEDTEILDARVDAEYQTHPNVGHNIRNIHSELLAEKAERLEDKGEKEAELERLRSVDEVHEENIAGLEHTADDLSKELGNREAALQRQIDVVSEVGIRTTFELHEQNDLRKEEIATEQAERIRTDEGLQRQVNANAEGITRNAHALQEESQARIEADTELKTEQATQLRELRQEEQIRAVGDDNLQRQVDANAEATLRTTFELYEQNTKRKEEIAAEAATRMAEDTSLMGYVDEKAAESEASLDVERGDRARADDGLQRQLDAAGEAGIQTILAVQDINTRRKEDIAREKQERINRDENLQEQIDQTVETSLRTALTVQDINTRRKAELAREAQARIAGDIALQELIDKTAEASLANTANIVHEGQQRRKSNERIRSLEDEAVRRIETDAYHQKQIDDLTLGLLHNSLVLSEALAQRRAALLCEKLARIHEDTTLQEQIDINASTILELSANLQQEADNRRKFIAEINEQLQQHLQRMQTLQIDLQGANKDITQLQRQTYATAETVIRAITGLHEESEKRREVRDSIHAEMQDEAAQEREIRHAEDTSLQSQIDSLAEGLMWRLVNEHNFRQDLSELVHSIGETPSRYATDDEISDVLDEVFNS